MSTFPSWKNQSQFIGTGRRSQEHNRDWQFTSLFRFLRPFRQTVSKNAAIQTKGFNGLKCFCVCTHCMCLHLHRLRNPALYAVNGMHFKLMACKHSYRSKPNQVAEVAVLVNWLFVLFHSYIAVYGYLCPLREQLDTTSWFLEFLSV